MHAIKHKTESENKKGNKRRIGLSHYNSSTNKKIKPRGTNKRYTLTLDSRIRIMAASSQLIEEDQDLQKIEAGEIISEPRKRIAN